MNNNAMTVKLWDEITEVQAENLNGGSGYAPSFVFGGPIGFVQINAGDGVQVNTGAINQSATNKFGFGGRRRHH
jgi:hypothetical protein